MPQKAALHLGYHGRTLIRVRTYPPLSSMRNAHLRTGFSRVDEYPAFLWRRDPSAASSLEFSRWIVVACAITFFAFFGFADEAIKNYKLAFDCVARRLGLPVNSGVAIANKSAGSSSFGYVLLCSP